MFNCVICVPFIFIFTNHVFSVSAVERWLPKCCPQGSQLSGDVTSCVSSGTEVSDTIVSATTDNRILEYRLEHKTQFSCVKHEPFLVQDDTFVIAGNNVVIYSEAGENWTLPMTEMCVDSLYIPPSQEQQPMFVALLCPACSDLTCLNKCCLENHQIRISEDGNVISCVNATEPFESQRFLGSNSKHPLVIHGFPTCNLLPYKKYISGPAYISSFSRLELPSMGMTVPRTEYCVDSSARGPVLVACTQPVAATLKPTLYGGFFCVGAVFLGLTLALHLWLPELRKTLHSRVLIAHVSCLLVGYLCMATVNLASIPAPSTLCSSAAFTIQFSILAAVFWLNVMCVDIAWTFSGLRAPKASLTLDSDGHKFLYYSLYAWGSTSAISAVTAFLEFSPAVPSSSRFKPSFGAVACWFQYSEAILLLMYGPMFVLLLSNIALFVYTACKIRRTQQDTANMVQHAGSRLRDNKDRFSLYLKLFGLMGVTWVLEVVSWLCGGPEHYWYATDAINAFRSVFIFILFCTKKKVLVLIKNKFSTKKTTKFPIHSRKSATSTSRLTSSMTSQRTNSIQLSQIS
ncbi:probable G-protein coupled receptor Mth-like 1 isoform X2 [Homalodisca vitripennis]|nr:probable G-protein coupled receptor Mth-like 1 isoform X2 [Homalodisca vitripennis]